MALHAYVDRVLFEPNRGVVSICLYSYCKLWDWRLVEEGKQGPGKWDGIESKGIKKSGGRSLLWQQLQAAGHVADSCGNHPNLL